VSKKEHLKSLKTKESLHHCPQNKCIAWLAHFIALP
jgi:hypothetical protein